MISRANGSFSPQKRGKEIEFRVQHCPLIFHSRQCYTLGPNPLGNEHQSSLHAGHTLFPKAESMNDLGIASDIGEAIEGDEAV